MYKVPHSLITKSLVGKQTSQNNFISAEAKTTKYNTLELMDFKMLKIQQPCCTLGVADARNKGDVNSHWG